METLYNFGDIVVVDGDQIGVVVKCWGGANPSYDVYVRMYNKIVYRKENEVKRYIYNKELLSEELETYV